MLKNIFSTLVMKKIIIGLACVATLVCGCATGTHIITGIKRPPIKPEQVTIYPSPPPKFETIGIINAQSPGRFQADMDSAVMVLKQQAAQIGANGIIIGSVRGGSSSVGFGSASGFAGGTAF